MTKAIIVLIGLATLFHCSDADTLANDPPEEVVIQGQPTWDNGMRDLIELKCAYCHAYPKPAIAPDTIVLDLDLTTYETRIQDDRVIRGADAIGRWIEEGILDGPVTNIFNTSEPRQMPLDYGTPVTEREKAFFELWSDTGSPKDNSSDPIDGNVARGEEIYGFCRVCHADGEGTVLPNGQFFGVPIRRETITTAKIKSMWLHQVTIRDPAPISDEDAAAIRAFMLTVLFPEE